MMTEKKYYEEKKAELSGIVGNITRDLAAKRFDDEPIGVYMGDARLALNQCLVEIALGATIGSKTKDGNEVGTIKYNRPIITSVHQAEISKILRDFINDVEKPFLDKEFSGALEPKGATNSNKANKDKKAEKDKKAANQDTDDEDVSIPSSNAPVATKAKSNDSIANSSKLSAKKYANEKLFAKGGNSILYLFLDPTDFAELVAIGTVFRKKRDRQRCIIGGCILVTLVTGGILFYNYEKDKKAKREYDAELADMEADGELIEEDPDGEDAEVDDDIPDEVQVEDIGVMSSLVSGNLVLATF